MLEVWINPVLINGETISASPRTSLRESMIDTGCCEGALWAPEVGDRVQSVYSLLIVNRISYLGAKYENCYFLKKRREKVSKRLIGWCGEDGMRTSHHEKFLFRRLQWWQRQIRRQTLKKGVKKERKEITDEETNPCLIWSKLRDRILRRRTE